jgi:hypothetical protein
LKTTTLKAETTTTAEVECKAEATEMVDNKYWLNKIDFLGGESILFSPT